MESEYGAGYGGGSSYGYGNGAGVMMSRVRDTLDHRVWQEDDPAYGGRPIGEIKQIFSQRPPRQQSQQRQPENQLPRREVHGSPARGKGKVPVYHPSKRTGWTRPESDAPPLKDPGWMPSILRGDCASPTPHQMQAPTSEIYPEKEDERQRIQDHRPGARRAHEDDGRVPQREGRPPSGVQQDHGAEPQARDQHHDRPARRDGRPPMRNSDESGQRPTMTPFREPRGRGEMRQLPIGHMYATEQERHMDNRKPPWVGSLRSSEKLKAWEVQSSESIAPDAVEHGDPMQHQAAESTTYEKRRVQEGSRQRQLSSSEAPRQQRQVSHERYEEPTSRDAIYQERSHTSVDRHERSSRGSQDISRHVVQQDARQEQVVRDQREPYYDQQGGQSTKQEPDARYEKRQQTPVMGNSPQYGSHADLIQEADSQSRYGQQGVPPPPAPPPPPPPAPPLDQHNLRKEHQQRQYDLSHDQMPSPRTRQPAQSPQGRHAVEYDQMPSPRMQAPQRHPQHQQQGPTVNVDTEPARQVYRKYNNPSGLYAAGSLQSPGGNQPQQRRSSGGLRSQGNVIVKGTDGKAYFNPADSGVYRMLQEEESMKKRRAEQYSARNQEVGPGREMAYHGYADPMQKSPTMIALAQYVMNDSTDF